MGLPVGSGVVESACGAVVADRLKRGGMRWTVAGANAMLALRCWILDRRLHDFQPAAARSPPSRRPLERESLHDYAVHPATSRRRGGGGGGRRRGATTT